MPQDYWRIELPFTAPLSLNHRQHWAAKAAKTRKYRALAGQAIMEENVPHERGHIRTWIEYEPRDARRRDPINLIPTLKVCEDALVDQGIVPDDCPEYVESVMPKILPKTGGKSGRLWLVIEEA